MSNQNTTPAPANDEGENTTPQKKPSLWSRAKARKARFVNDHPFAAEMGRQFGYGAAYIGGILALAAVYGAVTSGSSDDETPDELEAADSEESILSDDEE